MQKNSLSLLEHIITSPLLRWTWISLATPDYTYPLVDHRPLDIEAAKDMINGRYLLAGRLVETNSHSPFAIEDASEQWKKRLNEFTWLRHFGASENIEHSKFARVLVLDWVGRNSKFENDSWSPSATSLRILNWLRHLETIKNGASKKQIDIIFQSISTQLTSLKSRVKFMQNPLDVLYTQMALLGSSLSKKSDERKISRRLLRLQNSLDKQIDKDGLHLSRNALLQYELLSELFSLKQTLEKSNFHLNSADNKFSKTIAKMHLALDSLTLSTGELAYFNGAGQIATDLFVSLLSQGKRARKTTKILGGYGIFTNNQSVIIADSGIVPPKVHSDKAHASALAFEFSNGRDLIIGNCGAMVFDADNKQNSFRQGRAHSGIIINNHCSAKIIKRGKYTNHLYNEKKLNIPQISFNEDISSMILTSSDFVKTCGVKITRELSLIDNGNSLVGIDKISAINNKAANGIFEIIFHLAPNSFISQSDNGEIIYIVLQSGIKYSFLFEGGEATIKDTVRNTTYFGALPSAKIVIKSKLKNTNEVSWVFTRQQ